MNASKLAELQISEITIGKNNPRKTFDQDSIKELANSIAQKGVLQPILVRPKGKKYELVCGERRYRASKIAKNESIPANIRELDDDEAFEMQIIENLERKDVHPLEEAEAFKRMLDSGRYTQADIAAKMAKPETYIAQRLKLVELIPEIKKDFFSGQLGIGQAVDLARIPQSSQKEIYKLTKEGWNPGYGTQEELRKKIDRSFYELESAAFDTADESLIPKAGACHNCPKRSGCSPLLFPDIENKNVCTDPSCFNDKMKAHLINSLNSIIEGNDLLIGKRYGDLPDYVAEKVNAYKLKVLDWWDDYEQSDAKTAKPMLLINGDDAGKIITVKVKKKKGGSAKLTEAELKEQEISKIEERAARALELDNVKIFKAIREDEKLMTSYENDESELTGLEYKAMLYLFYSHVLEYSGSHKYEELTGHENIHHQLADYNFFRTKSVKHLRVNQLVRLGILGRLSNMHEPNFESCTRSRFFFQIMKEFASEVVKKYEAEQTEIANKRIVRTEQRLANLRDSL